MLGLGNVLALVSKGFAKLRKLAVFYQCIYNADRPGVNYLDPCERSECLVSLGGSYECLSRWLEQHLTFHVVVGVCSLYLMSECLSLSPGSLFLMPASC